MTDLHEEKGDESRGLCWFTEEYGAVGLICSWKWNKDVGDIADIEVSETGNWETGYLPVDFGAKIVNMEQVVSEYGWV